MLKHGDILLIQNRFDPLGWLLRYYTKSEWNHVAWCLNKEEYISADGTGIRVRKIRRLHNQFIYKVKAIRLQNLSFGQIRRISNILKSRQGTYNYLKFLRNLYVLKNTKIPNSYVCIIYCNSIKKSQLYSL
jgi:hypothetical protein